MKLDKPANKALFLHLGAIALGGLIGALLGKPNHFLIGICFGSLLATMVPGLLSEASLRRKRKANKDAFASALRAEENSLRQLCAAVFSNEWNTGEPNRDTVQEIRGQTYVTWFGVMVGALIAFYALNAALPLCLVAALLGGLIFWPISRCFS